MLIINKLNVDIACSLPSVSGWKQAIQTGGKQEMLNWACTQFNITFTSS